MRTISQLVVCFKVRQSTCYDSSEDHLSVGGYDCFKVRQSTCYDSSEDHLSVGLFQATSVYLL